MAIIPMWLFTLHHPKSGITAYPDDHTWHPDGSLLVRMDGRWFFAIECEVVPK